MPVRRARQWIASSRILVAVSVALAGATLVALRAQGPARPAQPAFRTGTTLIEVSAIATRGGEVVTDLRADEVVVRDNGTPQPIVAFEFVDLTAESDSPEQRRDFVVVLDDLGTEPKHTRATQNVALALIQQLGAHDRLAILNTGPFELVQQLSTDRDAARSLVRRFRGQKRMAFAQGACHAAAINLRVISNAARVMGRGRLERRTILVVSEGQQVYIGAWFGSGNADRCLEARTAYDDVVAATALTNTAVYGIDPRGLTVSIPVISAPTDREVVAAAGQMAGAATDALEGRYHGSLGLMATSTGGTLRTDRNDLAGGIGELIRDSRQYYRIAYHQPDVPASELGRPRRIEVSVTRRDVDVRARRRYMPR